MIFSCGRDLCRVCALRNTKKYLCYIRKWTHDRSPTLSGGDYPNAPDFPTLDTASYG
ncbi:hypothetical protein PHAMO_380037 [Magnetospirillum molischianum DSM 120]|uniref:Uncharacterized protein n=1 Tax=Magnetospirillum molischianum DSM 120 TaxID=1150626 RepID=H8FVI1_MAGML|nr:hypothetical protein PHAMO_380037 [Magnetospirillum molischianum DSM 120]